MPAVKARLSVFFLKISESKDPCTGKKPSLGSLSFPGDQTLLRHARVPFGKRQEL